jgi:hypothetical protein
MENIFIWMHNTLGVSEETGGKILSSVAAVILTGLVRWTIIFFVHQKTEDSRTRYQWRKGSLAEKHLRHASGRLLTFTPHFAPVVYTSVEDCGVLITLRYLCEPRRRRDTSNAIWEDVLSGFAECDDIDFAYPTQRFYDNSAEGKGQEGVLHRVMIHAVPGGSN